jgi:hypothetical protein
VPGYDHTDPGTKYILRTEALIKLALMVKTPGVATIAPTTRIINAICLFDHSTNFLHDQSGILLVNFKAWMLPEPPQKESTTLLGSEKWKAL